jgi:hypothetical protein
MPSPTSVAVLNEVSSPTLDFLSQISPGLGFVAVGLAASIATMLLRSALPEPPKEQKGRRLLHVTYPALFGMLFATVMPPLIPWAPITQRWFWGLLAPFLWAPFYELLRPWLERRLGLTLPSSGSFFGAASPPQGGPHGPAI